MKKSLLAAAVLSALGASTAAFAAEPASPHTVTGNAGVFSDYRFRGISQTFKQPAFQGGFDYAHASGFYAGNWNSNVSGVSYPNGGSLEMDFYGGYKTEVAGVGLDVGTLYYYYPGTETTNATDPQKYDNHEIYVGASYGPVSAKVSYALTDYFGLNDKSFGGTVGDSKGTTYAELNFSKEVMPKLTVSAHVGMTKYKNYKDFDYTDYKIGVGYDLSGFVFGLAYVGNSVKSKAGYFNGTEDISSKGFYTAKNGNDKVEKLYEGGVVLSVSKTF